MYPLAQVLSPTFYALNKFEVTPLNKNDRLFIEQFMSQKRAFLRGELSFETINVSPEIAESWQRSQKYNIATSSFKVAPALEPKKFKELLNRKGPLIEAAAPYFYQMEPLLAQSDCMLILSDENGVILNTTYGTSSLTKELNASKFYLFPGVIWNEKTVGTCAHAMTLIHKRPFQVFGPEHYNDETFGQTICSCAPIHNFYGDLEGTLSLSSPFMKAQSVQSLGNIVIMAKAIENELQMMTTKDFMASVMDARGEAVIIANHLGHIIAMNSSARDLLKINSSKTPLSIYDLLGCRKDFQRTAKKGQEAQYVKISNQGAYPYLEISIYPTQDRYQKPQGFMLIINETSPASPLPLSKPTILAAGSANTAHSHTFDKIVGISSRLLSSVNMAQKFAGLHGDILIQGESGTGKEVYAQSIHNESRPHKPFIAINCAAIPHSLIWSEMFGYDKGAFTGAEKTGKQGKIEMANTGTLFLDEIGDMPLDLQAVLLRVLEEKTVTRVGSGKSIPVDFRLITATNKDLLDLIKEKMFREDLYYRLAVYKIWIPPLRDRGWDVIVLAEHFIKSNSINTPIPILSNEAKFILLNYTWPGNVRQLRNAVLYALGICKDGAIQARDLPEEIINDVYEKNGFLKTRPLSKNTFEKYIIERVLEETGYNVNKTAEILAMGRSTLYRKLKQYGAK